MQNILPKLLLPKEENATVYLAELYLNNFFLSTKNPNYDYIELTDEKRNVIVK